MKLRILTLRLTMFLLLVSLLTLTTVLWLHWMFIVMVKLLLILLQGLMYQWRIRLLVPSKLNTLLKMLLVMKLPWQHTKKRDVKVTNILLLILGNSRVMIWSAPHLQLLEIWLRRIMLVMYMLAAIWFCLINSNLPEFTLLLQITDMLELN